MDVGEFVTRLRTTLDAYDENVLEVTDDEFIMRALSQAVLELKKVLRRPISETDITIPEGERGFTLPTNPPWMDFVEPETAIRLDPSGQTSEGSFLSIVPESALDA